MFNSKNHYVPEYLTCMLNEIKPMCLLFIANKRFNRCCYSCFYSTLSCATVFFPSNYFAGIHNIHNNKFNNILIINNKLKIKNIIFFIKIGYCLPTGYSSWKRQDTKMWVGIHLWHVGFQIFKFWLWFESKNLNLTQSKFIKYYSYKINKSDT